MAHRHKAGAGHHQLLPAVLALVALLVRSVAVAAALVPYAQATLIHRRK